MPPPPLDTYGAGRTPWGGAWVPVPGARAPYMMPKKVQKKTPEDSDDPPAGCNDGPSPVVGPGQ